MTANGSDVAGVDATTGFPIADRAQVWQTARALMSAHRRQLIVVSLVFLLAAGCGLAGPWLLGRIVDAVAHGTTAGHAGTLVALMLGFLLLQAVFTALANRQTLRTGEEVFAKLRDDFIEAVTKLPLSQVESAGTGDLVTRTTTDVDDVAQVVRYGAPQIVVSVVTIVATVVACVLNGALLSLSLLAGLPILLLAARWYLHRSTAAYRANSRALSELGAVTYTNVDSARTIDALRLGAPRRAASDAAIHATYLTGRRTLYLRTFLFPASNFAFSLPIIVTLLWGGWLATHQLATAGSVAAVTLYVVKLASPVEQLINWVDSLQSSGVALARLIGVQLVPPGRVASGAQPVGAAIELTDVGYSYRPGQPVLHGISLSLTPGERLAIVGPSGSGKSTLATLIAGINAPETGTATIGGVPLTGRLLVQLRSEVALVTQEHHVFHGSVAENVRLGRSDATDEQVLAALDAVGAGDWLADLPDALETEVGSGLRQLTPAQAQQVALARLILLDPATLVLDEATAMLDPSAARALERSMAGVLIGRTVVAIAHRLHTAHDADRIALLMDGRLVELGSHDELLATDGAYARLWRAWQDSD